ncbi:oxidoreductase [Dacryopinax primogenitus]|uniref:Electron transfer flavoprotein-ubiquinone oxidoreductase n=1 Tax=Dacryopinax primogenitus (strain DJM 731) TaxID=1858805 RepID=M5FYJ3_DACPD|nr:oxidoreductase [Dacryopinax primogenitus]EJU01589.1 oxidoreductase [Dacryopinax primogenitus]
MHILRPLHRLSRLANTAHRALHLTPPLQREPFDPLTVDRASDDVDVCIVGAGPAGLSAAIRLKQLEKERRREVRVVVLEKGSEVGAHILSGAVVEPRALNELLPSWHTMDGHPLTQPATSSTMRFLTSSGSYPMPHPPQMDNTGNYVLSLSQFARWLGQVAEDEGVEIYPGFAGAQTVYSEDGKRVQGVITNEVGLDRQGRMKDSFEPGMEFRAKVTLVAEGAHGSLSKQLQNRFKLRQGRDPQTYGLGVKEVWRVRPEAYVPGKTVHTMGWPLSRDVYGGGWLYHMADGMVSLGLVIGLDYANPYISPYREFQRMKHHPFFKSVLEGGECLAYGARTLNEGGLQSIPQLHFPGGALIGCSAGFLNVPKIKGTHNAMKSGMLAAEAAYDALEHAGEGEVVDMSSYEERMRGSWVWDELTEVRNLRPSFAKWGFWGGLVYSGVDSLILKGRTPWTLRTPVGDAEHTRKASEFKPIDYPPPQPPLSFDILTSVSLTGTNHAEDQPVHLKVNPGIEARKKHVRENVQEYAGLLGRACPAQVYEYVDQEQGEGTLPGAEENVEDAGWDGKKLVINSQNCIHCKLCDIKVPTQDINWTVPEGGGGPKYSLT